MEVLQSTKKDLDRLREYAFQVVRDFVFSTLFKSPRLSVTKNRKKATLRLPFFSFFLKKKISDSFFLSKKCKGTKRLFVKRIPPLEAEEIETVAGGHLENSSDDL